MRTRTFVISGLVAALLVAGVVSYWASSHPDGLQFVAKQAGFAQAEKGSPAARSPLSGYKVKGVENDAMSGGLAGLLGAVVVLVLASGLAYAVRRRGSADLDQPDSAGTAESDAGLERKEPG